MVYINRTFYPSILRLLHMHNAYCWYILFCIDFLESITLHYISCRSVGGGGGGGLRNTYPLFRTSMSIENWKNFTLNIIEGFFIMFQLIKIICLKNSKFDLDFSKSKILLPLFIFRMDLFWRFLNTVEKHLLGFLFQDPPKRKIPYIQVAGISRILQNIPFMADISYRDI